jgi:hypothetical protein
MMKFYGSKPLAAECAIDLIYKVLDTRLGLELYLIAGTSGDDTAIL